MSVAQLYIQYIYIYLFTRHTSNNNLDQCTAMTHNLGTRNALGNCKCSAVFYAKSINLFPLPCYNVTTIVLWPKTCIQQSSTCVYAVIYLYIWFKNYMFVSTYIVVPEYGQCILFKGVCTFFLIKYCANFLITLWWFNVKQDWKKHQTTDAIHKIRLGRNL